MQLYVGNTNILPGGIWTSEDGITWIRNDSAGDHCVRYENNILTLKNVTVLGEFNASGNTSGAGIYAVGQLNRSVSLNIELGQFTRNYTQTTKRGLLTTNKG